MDSRQGYSFKHSSFTFSSLPQCGQQSKCVREEDMLNGCGLVKQYTSLYSDMCSAHPGASTVTTGIHSHSQSSDSMHCPAYKKASSRTQRHQCLSFIPPHKHALLSTKTPTQVRLSPLLNSTRFNEGKSAVHPTRKTYSPF